MYTYRSNDFTSDEHEIYYCGQETLKRNGVTLICNTKLRRFVMAFNIVNDIIATIRIQCKPINITVLQVYARHPAQRKII